MPTFFTADTHFGHARIIEMCGRPFRSIEEHDAALVAAWNRRVTAKDRVWFLGDFGKGSTEHLLKIFRKLNGSTHLVRGNHDAPGIAAWPWASVHDIANINVDGQRLVLCHYPIASWAGAHGGAVHLHGHAHGRLRVPGLACDVGVDVWDYRPVTLAEIMLRLERREGLVAEPSDAGFCNDPGEGGPR
ncbi:MAG TPA: metallophosphoesterase [Aurantimonas coralicida]|uniref:Metallophosphoesterase n=1 Tax=Aurantimonas coralicida TaxID=182270 RepID=A0A9C9TFJ0_9HYPH|nr:metallophosphoesterase [Aurantimonas coralicida]HET99163.1 metallophosphoesterase [Aurantimonas coralicida]